MQDKGQGSERRRKRRREGGTKGRERGCDV